MQRAIKIVTRRACRCGEIDLPLGEHLATVVCEHGDLNYLVDAVRNGLAGESSEPPPAQTQTNPPKQEEPPPAQTVPPKQEEPPPAQTQTGGPARKKASARAKEQSAASGQQSATQS